MASTGLFIRVGLFVVVLATFKVISGRAPTCASGHSWRLYGVVPLGNYVASTMTRYPTQTSSQYYPNNAKHLAISHWLDSTMDSNTQSPTCVTSALRIRPARPVDLSGSCCR